MFTKIFNLIIKHKIISVIILLIIIAGGFFGYKSLKGDTNKTRYVLAAVEKGNLISSISGSGQVSALNQVDIKSNVSGDVVYIGVTNGQEVKSGALIAQINTADAQKSVRDAENNLELTKVSLEKMQGSDIFRGTKQKAIDDLSNAYEDGLNAVSNTFTDLSDIMTGLQTIVLGNTFGSFSQLNIDYFANYIYPYDSKATQYRNNTYNSYQLAKTEYDKALNNYKNIDKFSEKNDIELVINETYETAEDVAEALRNTNILLQSFKESLSKQNLTPNTLFNTYLSNINTYISKTDGHISNLLSAKNDIQSKKEAITDADFDITSQEIKVSQAEDALQDAQKTLNDCFVRAPFDGLITNMDIKKGDSINSGNLVSTLITKQNIAEITLNEVDAAKVKTGQKATLTFDAVSDLTLTGKVSDVDTVGTVSQGVVSYNAKITFDTQDDRIKPGMTVSVSIIAEAKQNALVVPNSAIKQQNGISYVESPVASDATFATSGSQTGVVLKNPTEHKQIETGSSNDEYTEVLSGLNEGDIIIVRTIQNNSTQTTSSDTTNRRTSVFGIPGGGVRGD